MQTEAASSSIVNKLKTTKVYIKSVAVKLTIISKNKAKLMQTGKKNSVVKHDFMFEQFSYIKLTPVLSFHFPS